VNNPTIPARKAPSTVAMKVSGEDNKEDLAIVTTLGK